MTDPLPDSVTGDNESPQMVVDATPLPDQAWAGLRQIAPPIMAFLIGRHLIDNDTAIMIGTVAAIIWPIVMGQLKTRHRATQLATLGKDTRVSNAIITTKG